MTTGAPRTFGAQLKAFREAAGFTQEELATIAGLSVHAVSALERGERRRPHVETVRALSAALDLNGVARDALLASARAPANPGVDGQPRGSLPLAPTALFGRDSDVRILRGWIADRATRLITLVGTGGVGKTRLALELASSIAAEGSTRVIFVPLAAIRDPAFVASAIAESLGLADITGLDLARRARIVCAEQPVLLVLDNFEQVLDAAPIVADLLTSIESLRLLVTSRAPLRLRGEREYLLRPLSLELGAAAESPAELARSPAVRLFLERVRDVQPEFRLTPANGPTVSAICRRLDALPLALELAAPWIKTLTAEGLLGRLERDPLLSITGHRDLPERQQTMNATVAWSYQLLQPSEQRAFRRFGVFPGLFPIDAAAAVLAGREPLRAADDDALHAAAALIDKSLLVRAETSAVRTCTLYQMLETVRAYAVSELTAAVEREDALEGLARYCAAESAHAVEGLVGRAQVEWLDRVREDVESYRAILMWLIERARPAEAADIAWRLMFFWLIRGHSAEGVRWYEQILAMAALPPGSEVKALLGAASMWYTQGDVTRARSALTRALELARSCGDREMQTTAELVFAHVEHAAGREDAARDHFVRSIAGFRALGIPWGTGNALSGLAAVTLASADAGGAERLLDEAAVALQDAGPWFVSLSLCIRAILAVQRGLPDAALAYIREGLVDIRDLHDVFALVNLLLPLAAAAVSKGEDAWAARIFGARDAVTERTGVTVVDESLQALRDRTARQVRSRLGEDRWERAHAAGRQTSIDSLLKEIDRILASAPASAKPAPSQ